MSEANDGAPPTKRGETVGQMKQRHKRELKDLKQDQKKRMHSFSKKDKAAKKEAQAECNRLEAEMKERHAKELQVAEGSVAAEVAAVVENTMAMAQSSKQTRKPTRQQRRKANRQKKEEETRARIEAEMANHVDERKLEAERFERQLTPLGLRIKDIDPDGNCLFNAVADQVRLHFPSEPSHTARSLRELSSQFMSQFSDDFLPYLTDEAGDMLTADGFKTYCSNLIDGEPIMWGGQPEIKALCGALKKRIRVFQAATEVAQKPLVMGEADASDDHPCLDISFHQHVFSLGDHYNSVVPIGGSGDPDEAPAAAVATEDEDDS